MKTPGGAVITINAYHTREVRDLAWACFSTPLLNSGLLAPQNLAVSNCFLGLTPEREKWLAGLDRDPAPLLNYLAANSSRRLGVYFEKLWLYFLGEDPRTQLVAGNLQVCQQGKTLGEYDIIYFCELRRQYVHLELAVKFYLSHRIDTVEENSSHWYEWLGPNSRDRLDIKIKHLMQHQIRLGEQPAAAAQLQQMGIEEMAKEVEIKGYLFQSGSDPLPAPRGYSRGKPLYDWYTLDQLRPAIASLGGHAFLPLPRQRWLAPAHYLDGEPASLGEKELMQTLEQHFTSESSARLIAVLDELGEEQSRFFVTPQNWPSPGRP